MCSPLSASHRCRTSGISIIEMTLTIAAIGILATVSSIAVNGVYRNTQHRKVETDVQTLNSAIRVYLSNGGSLDTLSDPNDVLSKLKTTRSKSDKTLHVGAPSGRLIDPRITATPVTGDSWKLRAVYQANENHFETVSTGDGVEFVLDENLAESAAVIETRSHGAVNYAKNSGWVWDHGATVNPNAPKGPNTFATNPGIQDSTPGTPVTPPTPPPTDPGTGPTPPAPPQIPQLPTPQFDKVAGAHPEKDFPLMVGITNTPSSDIAKIIYQLGTGNWTSYTGPVSVPMNTQLKAQFLTKDTANYRDSSEKSSYYYPVPESLSGDVDGNFHSPVGGPTLSYEITNSDDRFAHGNPVYVLDGEPINSGEPNVLTFNGKGFSNIPPGQKFSLGEFFYHNGSSFYDSHATGVALRIQLNLPDRGAVINFNLNLDLINTENDPDDAQASADYVKITNLTQNIPLQINGVNYRIQLEFGSTDSFGFSSKSQFHVYEGATGRGELLGTFLPR